LESTYSVVSCYITKSQLTWLTPILPKYPNVTRLPRDHPTSPILPDFPDIPQISPILSDFPDIPQISPMLPNLPKYPRCYPTSPILPNVLDLLRYTPTYPSIPDVTRLSQLFPTYTFSLLFPKNIQPTWCYPTYSNISNTKIHTYTHIYNLPTFYCLDSFQLNQDYLFYANFLLL